MNFKDFVYVVVNLKSKIFIKYTLEIKTGFENF